MVKTRRVGMHVLTMRTAVHGYISYEFLGLSRRVDPEMGHTEILTDHA